MDPSKYCHNVKRIRNEEKEDSSDVNNLTWGLKENDSEVVKRRKGIFPEFKPKKRVKKDVTNFLCEAQVHVFNINETVSHQNLSHDVVTAIQENSDFEIVKIQPMPEPLSVKCDDRPTKSNESNGKSSLPFPNKVIGGSTLRSSENDRFSEARGKPQSLTSQDAKCASLKTFSFKGNMLLKGSSDVHKQNKLATKVSYDSFSDSADENGNIFKNDIVPVSCTSGAVSPTHTCLVRSNKKVKFSGGMDEFSRGWIYKGEDLVLPDPAETSSSESDYDSEDYESLAARTPKSSRKAKDSSLVVGTKHFPISSTPKPVVQSPNSQILSSGVKIANKIRTRKEPLEPLPSLSSISTCSSRNEEYSHTEVYMDCDSESCPSIDESVNGSHLGRRDNVGAGQKQNLFPFEATDSFKRNFDDHTVSGKGSLEPKTSRAESCGDLQERIMAKSGMYVKLKSSSTKVSYDSSSDSDDETGNILPKRKSTENCDIVPVSCISGAVSPTHTCLVRSNKKAKFSGGMDEFSRGWIYKGEDLVLPDPAETSSSGSDYDSEDYESLAARTPKQESPRIGNKENTEKEVQMTKLLGKEDDVDKPDSEVHRKVLKIKESFSQNSKDIVKSMNQSVKSSEVFPPDSTSSSSDKGDKAGWRENMSSRKQICATGEHSSLEAVTKSRKIPGVQSSSSLLDKHNSDNQKRLTSLRQFQKKAQSQKSLIQQALKVVDSGSGSSKKTVFSSDDEEETPDPETVQKNSISKAEKQEIKITAKLDMGKAKTKLFDSSSDESDDGLSDAEMFDVKAQFEGEAGKRLMNLQSRFGNDPRFKLDHRFVESSENKDQKPTEAAEGKSEMKKMMQILQDVVGYQVPFETDSPKKLFKGPVRYDPTNEDHNKFEMISTAKRKTKVEDKCISSPSKNAENSDEDSKTVLPEVDKERFFEVSSSLKDAFGEKTKNSTAGGFSLLASFGKVDAESVKPVEKKTETIEVLSVDSQIKNLFGSDNSPGAEKLERGDTVSTRDRASTSTPKLGCFFTSDDPRLKEGVMAFSSHRDWSTIKEEWQENREYWVESYRSIHKRVSRRVKGTRSKRGKRFNLTF